MSVTEKKIILFCPPFLHLCRVRFSNIKETSIEKSVSKITCRIRNELRNEFIAVIEAIIVIQVSYNW